MLIYAHFDADDVVQDYVVHSLRVMGMVCSRIRFVTTSALPKSERAKLEPFVDDILELENVGFDFTMWKRCLETVDVSSLDELVLMNSSVYGPFRDAASLFEAMQRDPCDAWGITESIEHDRHLQSFFLVFRKSVLESEAFRTFWGSVLPYPNKRQAIRSYEVGLSQWLLARGFTLAAFCPWRQLARFVAAHPDRAYPIPIAVINRALRPVAATARFLLRHLHMIYVYPVNPTVAFAEELIELGVPFLKLEVVRDNPFGRDINPIRKKLESLGYSPELLLPKARIAKDGTSADGMLTTPAPVCPICGESGEVMHAGTSDVFRSGSARCWNIRKCRAPRCGCAWLDPVPLESEIHKAYTSYYTHPVAGRPIEYFAPSYGFVDRILLKIGSTCLWLIGTGRKRQEFWVHGLMSGNGRRLLEVGCGDGSRLADLQKHGWAVEGQDVDGRAAARARTKGLRVYDVALEEAGLQDGSYDVVLLSHVIEHVHHPSSLLRVCRNLLKPGGRIVLSTPNIESLGHRVYQRNWRALESPRHVVIHNQRSLSKVLRDAGFCDISVRTVPLNCELITMHSRDIKYLGWTDVNSAPRLHQELIPVAMQIAAMLLHVILPSSGEECFAVATRVDAGSDAEKLRR